MFITPSESRYVGGDHWVAILDSIADLKDHFHRDERLRLADGLDLVQDSDSSPTRSNHALLLYGNGAPVSRAELLAALPAKNAVDRYISRYFNRLDSVSVCEYLTQPLYA
jgi:hypothetical protein